MKQSFFADIGIHMSWLEPDLKGHERIADVTDLTSSDPRVHVPSFFIENRQEVRPVQDPIITMRRKDPPGVVRWEQRFAGTFMELLDLRYFPFDVQTLSIGAACCSQLLSHLNCDCACDAVDLLCACLRVCRAARELQVRRCAQALCCLSGEGRRFDQEECAFAGVAHTHPNGQGGERRQRQTDVHSPVLNCNLDDSIGAKPGVMPQ